MVYGFDIGAVIKLTTEKILDIRLLFMTVCTNSKSLYDCRVKLGSIQEKQLIVDLMCLRQSYERREIMKIRWIDGNSKSANTITKAQPCTALQDLIDTNTISLNTTG